MASKSVANLRQMARPPLQSFRRIRCCGVGATSRIPAPRYTPQGGAESSLLSCSTCARGRLVLNAGDQFGRGEFAQQRQSVATSTRQSAGRWRWCSGARKAGGVESVPRKELLQTLSDDK